MKIVTQFAIEQWEGGHQTHYESVEAPLSALIEARECIGGEFDVYTDSEDPDNAETLYVDLNISQEDYERYENADFE